MAPPRDLVAFMTSHFLPPQRQHEQQQQQRSSQFQQSDHPWSDLPSCGTHLCSLIAWTSQVHALASLVRRRSGEPTSVHVFSPCLHAGTADTIAASDRSTRIIVHRRHNAALERAVFALHEHAVRRDCCPQWASPSVFMLLRWEAMNLESTARVVVYLDMDVEVLPRWPSLLLAAARRDLDGDETIRATGRDWHHLVSCTSRSDRTLLSYPDHSSPVHGGLLFLRPNATLFREGVALLRRTAAAAAEGHSFNATLGWERLGPPYQVVPSTDDVWRRRRGHTHIVDEGDWGFVGGEVDQGFFFFMLRVRHHVGGDIRLSECASASSTSDYFHYGAVGGAKPEATLRRWSGWLNAHALCHRAKLVGHFAENGEVLLRSLGWMRRTAAEVQHLLAQQGTLPEASTAHGPHALYARSQLATCSSSIDMGLGCLAHLVHAHGSESVRVPARPFSGFGWCDRCEQHEVTLSNLWDEWLRTDPASRAVVNRSRIVDGLAVPTRPISLLAPARRFVSSYTRLEGASRFPARSSA